MKNNWLIFLFICMASLASCKTYSDAELNGTATAVIVASEARKKSTILTQDAAPTRTPGPKITPNTNSTSGSGTSNSELGWLCDYDTTGAIRLRNGAALNATVVDVVGTCTGCCVDVNMFEKKSVDGIYFYRIKVGNQTGWVDVDYYYPPWLGKPSWSTN